jgi:hypothetical protein
LDLSLDPAPETRLAERVRRLDSAELYESLDAFGYAHTPPILTRVECESLAALYDDDERFRKRVVMARHRFGLGDYAYFAHPLPAIVRELRTHLYRQLAPLANRWAEQLREAQRFPNTLGSWLERCHEAGQTRPTPLLLRYGPDGYNCLHQDLYGELVFPLQATVFLSRPGRDYAGGAFLLVEQRPRSQSRGEALTPEQGELVIFPSAQRPVPSARGFTRHAMRHGVARVTRGQRYTLGLIFHDAA